MKTYAFVSQKGGSGKTTMALHIAMEAAIRGVKTLLIDLDPQASARSWADRRDASDIDIDVTSEHAARLPAAILAAEKEGYALVIIDTAPNADRTAYAAASVADLVLVPCRPSILDLGAIAETLRVCAQFRRSTQVVLNAARVRSRTTAEARDQVLKQGCAVAAAVIHERVDFQHSLIDGRVAQEYRPESLAAVEIRQLYDLIAGKREGALRRKREREIA